MPSRLLGTASLRPTQLDKYPKQLKQRQWSSCKEKVHLT